MGALVEINISYSLLKSFIEYTRNEFCGYRLRMERIAKLFQDISEKEKAEAGQWFEYMVTGSVPRSGYIPEPARTKTGKLTALYEHLQGQMDNFNAIYQDLKLS